MEKLSSNTSKNASPSTHHDWSVEESEKLYGIRRWGLDYFLVNSQGHLCVSPKKNPEATIDFLEILGEIHNKGLNTPIVIRFQDILRKQVKTLNTTFRSVIDEAEYNGDYLGVYPIKVNQLREVVEEIVDAGKMYHYGLEAGSKAELISALVLNKNPQSLTIINGYKDREYIRLALLGRKIGKNTVIVIEKFSELDLVFEEAERMNIEPVLGIRTKMSTKGCGKWADSTGDNSKFGLSIPELLAAVNYLEVNNKLHTLKLFHFHIGSQIPDIRTIKDAVTEGARIFAQLCKLGAHLEYFDVGGGVGINYDGSHQQSDSSTNYNLQEYVSDVVYILKNICDEQDIEHPHIVSESGRAVTAHHSCVITNIFGAINSLDKMYLPKRKKNEHSLIQYMRDIEQDLNPNNLVETYYDITQKREEIESAFKLGVIDLKEKAISESLYWLTLEKICFHTKDLDFIPNEIKELNEKLAQKYLCNFSIFQSTADLWAINQVLPIVPLQKLNEKPEIDCTLADITCDSDGKIDHFIGPDGDIANTLKLHKLVANEPYYIGIFLTGAYQDIMGDMHNLFGRLNEVHVYYDEEDEKGFYLEETIRGQSMGSILEILQYSPIVLTTSMKKTIDRQVKRGKIKPREGVELIDFFENCLERLTYLNETGAAIKWD